MPGKGTTDVIFIMRNVEEKHHAKKKLYYAFADLEKNIYRSPASAPSPIFGYWCNIELGLDTIGIKN